jgi:membrane-bound serine protease (ClpP class)
MGEIYSPGAFFPGIIGGISLLIAFYSLGVLNAYWGGILLILLAFAFFTAEVFTTTFGLFTAGGVTSLVIGSLILFPGAAPFPQVDWWLIATTVICITAFFAFVINRVIRAHRHQPSAGREELVGKTAVVKIALGPKGVVLIEGERWTAVSEKGRIEPEEEVIITRVDGLKLWVTKKE